MSHGQEEIPVQQQELKFILDAAVNSLFKSQPNVFSFTSETGQTEWNLAHHLANEIHAHFIEYDCDLDVTKRNYHNRRPDIIIHQRDTHDQNLLVIELKYHGYKSEIKDDINKIHEDWFHEPLNYRFGAVINIESNFRYEISVFENPTL